MKTRILIFAALSAGIFTARGEEWTLERCVDYAREHNISVRSAATRITSAENELTSAKDAFLPRLEGSASQSFNFGRGLTAENIYADRNTSNFQWGFNLNMPLFQGLGEYKRLKMARTSLEQMLYEHEAAKDNVALNVISLYLQVLYCKEVEKSAESQAGYSAYEVGRQKELVAEGRVAEADLYDAEAQAAQDALQLVQARNDTQMALVNLANLLQLREVDGFDVGPLQGDEPMLPRPEAVFNEAMGVNNTLLGARKAVLAADESVALAKTGYIPTLSFNAGLGSSYFYLNGLNNDPFGRQMRNNYSTYLGFSLRVPIFDAFSTRNNVRTARVNRLNAQLQLEQQETELFKNIQLAYYQALGAQERYLTSEETLSKTMQSFEATREKYSLGRATPQDFEIAKNNLFRTEVNRIQAHYEYLLRHKILQFYRTNGL
ncbi:MAG: TolC family protein [Muribaculaceae bacterium]|nr:TolC family protein [Muribaculaceae bacterium]